MSGHHHSVLSIDTKPWALPRFRPGRIGEMLAISLIAVSLLGSGTRAEELPADPLELQASEPGLPSGEELSKLLPLLLTSPERKAVAAEIEGLIRSGDLKAAETRLNAAIDAGTLAIVLVNKLGDPGLLQTLQALGIRGGDQPSAAPSGEVASATSCPIPPESASTDLLEAQQALEQEKAHGSALAQELAALNQAHGALVAQKDGEVASVAARAAELEAALQREQERRETAAHQLAGLQEEYRLLKTSKEQDAAAAQSKAAALEGMLRQERERSAATALQLAGVEEELRALQSGKQQAAAQEAAQLAEMKDALGREKARGDAVTRELADALEELRLLQEPQNQNATPVMLRLESDGVPSPVETSGSPPATEAPQAPPVQTVPSVLFEPVPVKVASTILPDTVPLATAALPEPSQAAPALPAEQPKTAQPPAPEPVKAEPPAPVKPEDKLVARANDLFRTGDVSGARLLLERSVEAGNARAAFLLAETFDPHVLSRMGTMGIRGDAVRARELYGRAQAMGVAQAGERLEALK